MKTKLFFLILFVASQFAFAQEYIFGKVSSEFGDNLPNSIIINTRTEEKVLSDRDGNYMILAKSSDQLRIVRQGFHRAQVRINSEHFKQPVNVVLKKTEELIPEVTIAFKPTGNIEKDTRRLDLPHKTVALNYNMRHYMKTPFSAPQPKLTTPSAFSAPNFSAGIVNIGGVAKAVSQLVKKAKNPVTTPNYAEVQSFYKEVKQHMNFKYYTDYGLDEEEINLFLVYVEDTRQLAKKYRKNFSFADIDTEMKSAFHEYLKIRKG